MKPTLLVASFALTASIAVAGPIDSKDVTNWSPGEVESLTNRLEANGSWWARIENQVFSPAFAPESERDLNIDHYVLSVGVNPPATVRDKIVASASGYSIIYDPQGEIPLWLEGRPSSLEACRFHSGELRPLESGFQTILPASPQLGRRGATGLTNEQVQALVDQVDQDRYYGTVETLAAFNSRNTFSSTVDDARDWIAAEMTDIGLTVTTPSFSVSGTTAYNVVGVLQGTKYPEEFLVVGAHYDSLPSAGAAPGAEDNASGSAGVLETARALVPFGSQKTVVFVCFSGEEQGLYGSFDFVSDLSVAQRQNLQAALIMDMVSFTADAEYDVLLESDSLSSPLLLEMAAAAEDFTDLAVYTSDNPFGSDHIPFIQANLDSVLAIENDWDVYPDYHRRTDDMPNITRELGADIVRMNVATIARMANPDPVVQGANDGWMIF